MRSSSFARLTMLASLAAGAAGCAARETHRSAPVALGTPVAPSRASASMSGSRGSPAVGRFVRERNAQLQFCYQEARAQNAALAGTVTVAVTLGAQGDVLESGILRRSWSGNGAAVERCVLATVRRWRFPAGATDDDRSHSFAVIFSGDAAHSPQ